MPCHLEPAIRPASMEIMWWNEEDLVCHCKDGQMIESYEGRVSLSLQDLHNGNVSLTLRDVRRSQKGLCICEVSHECQTLQDTVFLSISCKYSNKHVSKIFDISQFKIVPFTSTCELIKCIVKFIYSFLVDIASKQLYRTILQ